MEQWSCCMLTGCHPWRRDAKMNHGSYRTERKEGFEGMKFNERRKEGIIPACICMSCQGAVEVF